MRVASLNIHKGRGLDGRVDLERLGAFLAESKLDLVGLQEVVGKPGQEQVKILGELLKMEHYFFPSFKRGTFHFGNALLSKELLVNFRGKTLPSSRETRSLLIAELPSPAITIAVTHLGLNFEERRGHVDQILGALPAGPIILMGDLNAESNAPELQGLFANFGDAYELGERSGCDTHTFLNHEVVPSRIDFILVRGLAVLRYQTRGTIATDHRLVVVDVAFPDP